MSSIFKSDNYNNIFLQNGYILPNEIILNDYEVKVLVEYYHHSKISNETLFDVTKDNPDKSKVKEMLDVFEKIVIPKLRMILGENIEMIVGSFLCKAADINTFIPPHQDDTIIDISEPFSAFTCWIPLEDVSYSNGCMGLIKGGHLLFNNICANPADYAQNIKQEYIPILSKYMNWLEIKAGKTIIVNHNTPHASLPNFSKKNRLAIALLMTDSRATLCNYFKNPKKENSILKYKVNKDFFINYSNERLLNLYNNNCLIEEYPISEELECNQQDMNLSFLENKLFEYGNMPNNKYELYLKYKNSSSNKILYKIKNLFRRISNATAT